MFWFGLVTDWRVPGEKRVRSSAGNLYILNTNRMFEITANHASKASMIFFDNGLDEKDSGNRLVTSESVASTILPADTDHGSNEVTLNYYPDNDITVATKAITLRKEDIGYCYPRNFDLTEVYTYVVYREGAWDTKRILVSGNWIPIWAALET